MIKLILIVISLSFAIDKNDAEKVDRAQAKKDLLNGCLATSDAVADKKKAICNCVVDNFDKKANDFQMRALANSYDPKYKEADAKRENVATAASTFDYEVATECINNPKWRIKD